MDDFKSEKWTLDDGRRAERRITENALENGQSERVIEVHVEDERPLKLKQRVVEKSKPIIYERKVETIDPNTGNVVELAVESIEPKVQMQLVEHIATTSVNAQSAEKDCECYVTKEQLVDAIALAANLINKQPDVEVQSVSNNPKKLASRAGLAEEIANRETESDGDSSKTWIYVAIIAQVAAIFYILLM